MIEGRGIAGYSWIQDLRYDDYYYLKDFEHLVVMRVQDSGSKLHWEAIVYADETCSKITGRQEFKTRDEAQECLERIVEISLKNRKKSA
ncbi:MAG: hypothetical protein HYX48_04930 [Chlamydiales bacterium]|nr:hypothetical protein [Chlamydiales bacterium]